MKHVFAIVFLLTATIACENEESAKTATIENGKLIQQYFEHFNNHDWRKLANMYSETVEFKDPSLGSRMVTQTRQQIIDKYSDLNKTFPDVNDKVVKVYHSGEKNVIVEFISTGTAPDSSKFEMPICTIFTIEEGVITKDYTYYDNFEENPN